MMKLKEKPQDLSDSLENSISQEGKFPNLKKSEHFGYLQSCRGIAAVIATINHWCGLYYPHITFPFTPFTQLEALGRTPLSLIVNGQVAVRFFFILSSFVLAHGHFKELSMGSNNSPLPERAARRWPRLVWPVIGANLFSFIVWKIGAYAPMRRVAFISGTTWIMHAESPGEIHVVTALENAIWTVWTHGNSRFGAPLWTMKWELTSSWFTLLLALVAGNTHRNTSAVYLCVMAWLMHWSTFQEFGEIFQQCALGVAFAHAHAFGLIRPFINRSIHLLLLCSFLYFAMYPSYAGQVPLMWWGNIWYTFAVCSLFIFLLTNKTAQLLLESKILLWLGKNSFSIYVLHDTIQNSICAHVFLRLLDRTGFDVAAVIVLVLVEFPIVLALSQPFTMFFDMFMGQVVVRKFYSILFDRVDNNTTVNCQNSRTNICGEGKFQFPSKILSAAVWRQLASKIYRYSRAHRAHTFFMFTIPILLFSVDSLPNYYGKEPCSKSIMRIYNYSSHFYQFDIEDGPLLANMNTSNTEVLVEPSGFSTFTHNFAPNAGKWVTELSACNNHVIKNSNETQESFQIYKSSDINNASECRSLGFVLKQQRRVNGWLARVDVRSQPHHPWNENSFLVLNNTDIWSWNGEPAVSFLAPFPGLMTYC